MSAEEQVDALFAPWDRDDSPGCAVAVMREGVIVYSRGYGRADLEHKVPNMPSTVFHVASLSKQFTGFATLLLAAEGKLGLDDDIRLYVPDVPRFARRITLRHLLHHTSGLRNDSTLLKLAGWRPMDVRVEADICDVVRRQRTLNFQPGEDFNYCNTGYVLLASAIQRASGSRFRDFVHARIFRPLGMTASRVRDDHSELVKDRAFGYAPTTGGAWSLSIPDFDFAGPTNVYTTVEDVRHWANNLIDPRVGGAAVVRQLTTAGKLTDGRSVRYGAGLEIDTYRGLRVVKHSGWDLGYMAHLAVYPAERFAVAILGNFSTLPREILARRIADVYLADRFRNELPPAIDVSERVLARKAGLYRHPRTHRAMWIHHGAGGLRLASERNPASGMPLQPLTDTTFRGSDETTGVVLAGGALTIREQVGVPQIFRHAEPWVPSPGALPEYTGTYRGREVDASLTVTAVGDDLVVGWRKWPAHPVASAYRDAFTDDIATYRFTRRARRVTGVELSLDRVSHLRFDRVPDR